MSSKDVKDEANITQEKSESKFNDSTDGSDEVMSKHLKWDLQTTRSHTEREEDNGESSGCMKRSRTFEEEEEEDYDVSSNSETSDSDGSTIQLLGKRKASQEIAAEIRALRLIREDALELMKKRLELSKQRMQKKLELSQQRMQRKLELSQQTKQRKDELSQQRKEGWAQQKNDLLLLNTLLQKDNLSLSPEEQKMKRYLMSKHYGI